eukprot:3052439-Pyramimonas_sp.AAC.1
MPGECRCGPGEDLEGADRRFLGHRRQGTAPREPYARPASSPVADAQPQLADGTDLAADDEQQARNTEAMSREDRVPDAGSAPALAPSGSAPA